jgi:uncharacterized membrane protein YcaP (DUF421 family)
MEKQDIHLDDWKRILFGQAPPEFLLEVFIRTFILYIILLIVVRLLGKRMAGQLTILEFAVMLTIGAIVSASMQLPDKGILQGVWLLLCILALQRGITLIGYYNNRFENLIQGQVSLIVKNGVLQLNVMASERISREQVFAQLRLSKIFNLGDVERMYLEACGVYSIYKSDQSKPGLDILPKNDDGISHQLTHLPGRQNISEIVCSNCGFLQQHNGPPVCSNCSETKWQEAILYN